MLRNYFFINVVLVIVTGLLGLKLYGTTFQHRELPSKPTQTAVEKQKKKTLPLNPKPAMQNYEIIKTKNLFTPSRTANEGETDFVSGPASSKNPPKLFGTILLNNEKTAILEDPDTKKTGQYRVDDIVSGFKVAEIQEDKVVLLSGGDKVTVRLREDKGVVSKKPAAVRKPVQRRTPRRRVQPNANRSPRKSSRRRVNVPPQPGQDALRQNP